MCHWIFRYLYLCKSASFPLRCVTNCCQLVSILGVIFALKVLTTFYNRRDSVWLFGFPVPSKYSVWIELVIIHLLVPRASFTGHLAGILVGVAYTSGIIKMLVDLIYSVVAAAVAATPLRAANSSRGEVSFLNALFPF